MMLALAPPLASGALRINSTHGQPPASQPFHVKREPGTAGGRTATRSDRPARAAAAADPLDPQRIRTAWELSVASGAGRTRVVRHCRQRPITEGAGSVEAHARARRCTGAPNPRNRHIQRWDQPSGPSPPKSF